MDDGATERSPFGRLIRHSASRYLFAGGLAFLVDVGILALLRNILEWPLWLATGVAFVVSFFFTYTIQRLFSFESTAAHGGALFRYAVLVGFNTVAVVIIVTAINPTPIGWLGGKVIATVMSTVWNYFAYRYWVFADSHSTTKD
ncbi:GtrA family protein [Cryobacterium mannosilyticum]|uniref:GtrA family protein n=1 Tax=Cryobacterium mannosilyticum TaxID=1259190 RepID=UPI00141BB062|nr:GtrA family protein [Cryobacterium mannosilyticum]